MVAAAESDVDFTTAPSLRRGGGAWSLVAVAPSFSQFSFGCGNGHPSIMMGPKRPKNPSLPVNLGFAY